MFGFYIKTGLDRLLSYSSQFITYNCNIWRYVTHFVEKELLHTPRRSVTPKATDIQAMRLLDDAFKCVRYME